MSFPLTNIKIKANNGRVNWTLQSETTGSQENSFGVVCNDFPLAQKSNDSY